MDRLEAVVDRMESTINRLDAVCHGLDRFGRTMHRWIIVLTVLNMASTSLIGYVAVQIGSGHPC